MMVDGIDGSMTARENVQLFSEYQDVIEALKTAFPDITELEIEQAIIDYAKTHGGTEGAKLDSQQMLNHIKGVLDVKISNETAKIIKKEWEELVNLKDDIGVSDLAGVLDTYSKEGIKADRGYLMLLWEMLQEELEKAAGEEGKEVADADLKGLRDGLKEQIKKQIEQLHKSDSAKFWGKFAKWAGVVASLIGAAVAIAAAAIAIATGVGAVAGVALIGAATIMTGLAVAAVVSASLDEAGVEWSLGSGLGKLIAMGLNELGADINVDEFGMWFSLGVQITLTLIATVLSLGAGIGTLVSSATKASADVATKAAETAAKIATTAAKVGIKVTAEAVEKSIKVLKVINSILTIASALCTIGQATAQGVQAGISYDLAMTQAELLELRALLEKLLETRNVELELMAAILSKIFEAMRGHLGEAMDVTLQDMDLIASLNLPKA